MPSAPLRLFRPDFRTVFTNLSPREREMGASIMDSTYDSITKTVDEEDLDETDTARLVHKYLSGAIPANREKCCEVIMGAIWPPPPKHYYIVFDSARITNPVSASDPKPENVVEGVKHAPSVKTSDHKTDRKTYKVFQVTDPNSTVAMDDDNLIIEKEGRAVPLLGHLCGQLPIAHSGESHHAKQMSTIPDVPINADTTDNATQAPLSGGPSTSDLPIPDLPGNSTRVVSYFPMPCSIQELKRSYAMTEVSLPGAQAIVLGPLPPPHVRTSSLPLGRPPYDPGACYNVPGVVSDNSNPGATSRTSKEVASASTTPSVVSAQRRNSMKKRSRDDEDEEESIRPSSKLRIEAQPRFSIPDNATTSLAVAPSSKGSGSPKKCARHGKEDEEELTHPSTSMRQEPHVVRPPTNSDRRIGRIIAPFGKSTRFNPP